MFKSDEEVKALIESPNNNVAIKILGSGQDDRSDRTPHSKGERLSTEEKVQIGLIASVLGIKKTSEITGKTPGVIGRISRGEDSQGNPAPELSSELKSKRDQVQDKGLALADKFMDMLLEETDSTNASRKALVAEKMVNIYEKLAPKTPPVINATQVIFYAPRIREASEYQILDVEAQNG